MKHTLLAILFIFSLSLSVYCSIKNIEEQRNTFRVKKQLAEYVIRINQTNSMAVESAYQDSINNTIKEWLLK